MSMHIEGREGLANIVLDEIFIDQSDGTEMIRFNLFMILVVVNSCCTCV